MTRGENLSRSDPSFDISCEERGEREAGWSLVFLPSNCLTEIMAGTVLSLSTLSAVSQPRAGVELSVFTTTATDTIGCADAGPGFVEDEPGG